MEPQEKEYFGLTVVDWIWLIGMVTVCAFVLDHALELERIRVEKHGY